MKLTWFGKTTFRVHIGGQILVIDPDAASSRLDRNEVMSGADQVIAMNGDHPAANGAAWKPRPAERLLDAGDAPRTAQIWALGPDSLLIDADEDMPLLVLGGDVPPLGRWVERAAVVLAGGGLALRGAQLAGTFAPRLMALAGSEAELDAAFAQLPPLLDGTALLALEPGLAVEV